MLRFRSPLIPRRDSQPEDVPKAAWNGFRRFLETSDAATFTEFVRLFEWSTGNQDAAGVQTEIVSRLRENAGAIRIRRFEMRAALWSWRDRVPAASLHYPFRHQL